MYNFGFEFYNRSINNFISCKFNIYYGSKSNEYFLTVFIKIKSVINTNRYNMIIL